MNRLVNPIKAIRRESATQFSVQECNGPCHVVWSDKFPRKLRCSCMAARCGHRDIVLSSLGLGIGGWISIGPAPAVRAGGTADDGMLDGQEFDAEAGRDVVSELEYMRSGREKRNMGC